MIKLFQKLNNPYVELSNCKLSEYCNLAHHSYINNSEVGKRFNDEKIKNNLNLFEKSLTIEDLDKLMEEKQ